MAVTAYTIYAASSADKLTAQVSAAVTAGGSPLGTALAERDNRIYQAVTTGTVASGGGVTGYSVCVSRDHTHLMTLVNAAIAEGKQPLGGLFDDGRGNLSQIMTVGTVNNNVANILSAPLDLYVRPDGNDSNDGSANTAAKAFLTISRAMIEAAKYNTSSYSVRIHLADGTYTETVNAPGMPFGPDFDIQLIGNTTTPANVVVDGFVTFQAGKFLVKGISGFARIGAFFGCQVEVDHCLINANSGFIGTLNCGTGSFIYCHDTTVNVSGYAVATAANGGLIELYAIAVTGGGFTEAFATAQYGGMVSFDDQPTGTCTGPRYKAKANGIIETYGGAADFLPGDSAGSVASGGQYL